MISVLISVFAIAIVVILTWQSNSNHPQNPAQFVKDTETLSTATTTSQNPFASIRSRDLTSSPTWEIQPLKTSTHIPITITPPTSTQTIEPTSTPNPTHTPTIAITATPDFKKSGYEEICDPMVYEGIERCMKGPYHVVKVNPKNPYVRFEIVLPMGYDRYGNYGECRDVQLPDSVQPGESTGPGCFIDHSYPAERIVQMVSRYEEAVLAFNGDFFSPSYAFGAMGLTVKNGERLDGNPNDREGREVRRSSLSISVDGDIRIGPISLEQLTNPDEPWNWFPDPEDFYQTIGGLPMLVKDGHPLDLHEQCMQEQGWCPDQYYPRARTAVGKTFEGQMIIVVVPEEWGLTLEGLSHLMVELGCEEAINLDGGGSSQLWYDGSYLNYSSRVVAEGVIILSTPISQLIKDPRLGE
jgi:hypothetical protein